MWRNWKDSWNDATETWSQGIKEVEELKKTNFQTSIIILSLTEECNYHAQVLDFTA